MARHMGHLSGPQVTGLALWSWGLVLGRACGLSRVAAVLAAHLGLSEPALRQRLREWTWDRVDKPGLKRRDWPVRACFAPLLAWVLSLWSPTDPRLVLALDATSLKKVFVVLSVSVVYRGCAIPVAWAVLPEGQKGSWKGPWLELMAGLRGAVPAGWQVLVLADRGLYARWLYQAIRVCGWHPFLRLNQRSTYRPRGQAGFCPMGQLLPGPGAVWAGRVTCFRHNSVEGTLVACWGPRSLEPWLILTDLPPETARASWYGMRGWVEQGFKDFKRDGWGWHKTRMTDPARAARLWLALAVASLWVVSVGGQADARQPTGSLRIGLAPPPRHLSCFTRGLLLVLTDLLAQRPIRLGILLPEPWPLKTYP